MGHVDAVIADAGNLGQQLTQPPLEVVPASDRALPGLALEALDDLGGRARSDVRVDQDLLEALPRRVVERPAEGGSELAAERLTRLREVLAQPPEETARCGSSSAAGGATSPRPSGVMKTSCQVRAMAGW